MHLGDPVDCRDGLSGLADLVGPGPRTVSLRSSTGDADHRVHSGRMFHGVANAQITAPGVADHDPAANTGSLADAFKIGDGLFHGVRAAGGAPDATRFGIPGSVAGRRDVVSFQVLHAARSAAEDDNIGPLPRHTDMQVDAL